MRSQSHARLRRRQEVRCAEVPRAARIMVVLWVVAAAVISGFFLLHGAWPVALAELVIVCALWAAFAVTRR